jgi:hypothetical protein
LRQLLDLEARLAEEVRAARQEAEAIRAQGEEAARPLRLEGEKAIVVEEQALLGRFHESIERDSRAIADDLVQRKETLLNIPVERIDTIARDLLTRLVEGSLGGAS